MVQNENIFVKVLFLGKHGAKMKRFSLGIIFRGAWCKIISLSQGIIFREAWCKIKSFSQGI
jgi:hypothetical protein